MQTSTPGNPTAMLATMGVRWTTPGRDAVDSMPLSGQGGTGANVWLQGGSLWIYLGHGAAFDEQGRLLKLGCVRLTPGDGLPDEAIQELELASGSIRITAAGWNARLWFADEDLVVESVSAGPVALAVAYATWRDRSRDDVFLDVFTGATSVGADQVEASADGMRWSHRNAGQPSPLKAQLELQPWAERRLSDPTRDLIFGGALAAAPALTGGAPTQVSWQGWSGTAWTFTSGPSASHRLVVALRAERDGDPALWLTQARARLAPAALAAARIEADRRWTEFWSRSWIEINPGAGPADPGWQVGRNYQLFRFMLGCNQGGRLPLLFNGGIFTVDNLPGRVTGPANDELKLLPAGPSTPDFRRWMFCGFMAQNQRWLGWPGIAAGDADLVAPSVAFYRLHAATAAARAERLGAEGVVYPEPLMVWGLNGVHPRSDGLCGMEHLLHAFAMMLEHAWMALCAHRTLGSDIAPDLPWIFGTIRFFDSFYRNATMARTGSELGPDGKLLIYPANSIELATGATNPVEVVAGLHRITAALLELKPGLLDEGTHRRIAAVADTLPELPYGEHDGQRILLCARSYEKLFNIWELPEFYAVWPYRLLGVTRPGTTEVMRATWDALPPERAEKVRTDFSWMPLVVNLAGIGDAAEAQKRIVDKISDRRAGARFTAFFGPGHDWLPDHNWGGSAMVGLQEMLLAADPYGDGRIHLFPAWPRDWDVRFKLHAPGKTTVEAELKGGKLVALSVDPPERKKDVVVHVAPTSVGTAGGLQSAVT